MRLTHQNLVRLLSVLICLSGGCALVYQMVWLREFRLIFGAATPANAAVLGVFMGGLGVGGIWLGRKAERFTRLLRIYGLLELAISTGALLTPWILQLVRAAYIQTGGVVALGSTGAILLQILLAILVLSGPCILMGGTLPVAVKCIETEDDYQRGSAGLLYGLNALGALAGVGLSTFWLLEDWGTRGTLYLAVGINALVGLVAWWAGSQHELEPASKLPDRLRTAAAPGALIAGARAPAGYVYGAAWVTGFVFFLVELVWNRMTAPLLGSSTYNFGIVVALALAGIGSGGVLYRVWVAPRVHRASLSFFGLVASLQALLLILPYALGDRVAVFAYHASQLRSFGFEGQVGAWFFIAGILVLGPSVLAGVQFPLLLSLLGAGRAEVGRQLGSAYAWNTAGAIAGSLLGGFVLLPWLTAPGCWRLATWLTLTLGALALGIGFKSASRRTLGGGIVLMGAALGLSLLPLGPTGAWRHTPIGYGRVQAIPSTPNGLRDWYQHIRRSINFEIEGRESSLAIDSANGYSILVNGKSDGSAQSDAPTQVMLGLLPALLHPQPRSACVVGLGTGSTAGWLADVSGMERVDVVEIEPGMRDLARNYFAPLNRGVMHQTNVQVHVGDAREVLLVKGPSYDLIVSEPSNPCRAGIASLFTTEYYQAVRHRLNPGGLFGQWVQAYEIDSQSVRLIYATLSAVFPYVETWVTKSNDIEFICHLEPPAYPLERIRQRVAAAPFAEALRRHWMTGSAEGVLAHHLAAPAFARGILSRGSPVNTDDHNFLEFGFVRALVQDSGFDPFEILRMARGQNMDLPEHLRPQLDADRVLHARLLFAASELAPMTIPELFEGDAKSRAEAIAAYVVGNHARVIQLWRGELREPMEQLMLVEAMAHAGRPDQARPIIDGIRETWPLEARFAAAHLAARHGSPTGAVEHLSIAFAGFRTNSSVRPRVVQKAMDLARDLGQRSPEAATVLFDHVSLPFSLGLNELQRLGLMVELSRALPSRFQVQAADAWGKSSPWTREFLEFRRKAYAATRDPRLGLAEAEFEAFLKVSGRSLAERVAPTPVSGGAAQ